MKYCIVVLMAVVLGACFPFPAAMQDDARSLGHGKAKVEGGLMLDRLYGVANIGVGRSSDIYLQRDHNQITTAGVKRNLIDVPESHSFAMTAGGFATKTYRDENGSKGRDTGGFIGATTNWYTGNGFFALQLRHSMVDHHSSFAQYNTVFDSGRYEHVTQLGFSYRFTYKNSNSSFKTGLECYMGSSRLPESNDPAFERARELDKEPCNMILGFSRHFSLK